VNVQLRIEYLPITNQTLHSFPPTVQSFQWWIVSCPLSI